MDNPSERRQPPAQVWAVQGYLVRYPKRRFVPPADIIELDDRVIVLVEIAGMRSDGFKIALYSQELIISGTRARPDDENPTAYHQAEIGFGDFRLHIPITWSVAGEAVRASYNNGFLRVELPRQQARRIHIVDVHTDEGE